jgi:hypothetical protein
MRKVCEQIWKIGMQGLISDKKKLADIKHEIEEINNDFRKEEKIITIESETREAYWHFL